MPRSQYQIYETKEVLEYPGPRFFCPTMLDEDFVKTEYNHWP